MTIDVAFMPSTHTSQDIRRYEGFKKYRFICTLHGRIRLGDIIWSPDYNSNMIVTAIHPKDESTTYNGIVLKTITISTINGCIQGSTNNTKNMDTRNISITLEQARKWYNSGNETLKKLALSAYTEGEIQPDSYEGIMKDLHDVTTCSCLTYPAKEEKAVKALNKLRSIAAFFNKGWQKGTTDTGYFVIPNTQLEYFIVERKYGWVVLKHCSVRYPGVIYFQSPEAALKALKIAYIEGWLNDLK